MQQPISPQGRLPRLDREHPPVHTYYFVTFEDWCGYRIEHYRVQWDVPHIWDAILTQLARVTERADFSCWLDSALGDEFLAEHNWRPLLEDGVLSTDLQPFAYLT
jgi:hypothetical protein